ncbi:MAG: hypothetical protein ACTHJT_14770 [Cytophaga sp.]|uniref:hypothetical protein n=1 Tax=Cytophaga sp. TaxID=29535 RepID=UPI003F807FD8
MNYLVYQSYGSTDILNECCYSILSLLKHGFNPDKTHIVIYTDRKEYFSFLPSSYITFVEMDAATIEDYKGPHKFIHRVKIKVLQDCSARFTGKIIYTDSDIYFLNPIESLFDQIGPTDFLMCNNEGRVDVVKNNVCKKFFAFLSSHASYLKENNTPIPVNVTMWNAGIIGFISPREELLDKVLHTNDVIFDKFTSHVVEQLAFSHQLAQHGTIHKSTDYVFHYWKLKEFRMVLAEFFAHHLPAHTVAEMILDVDSIRPDVLIQPKLEYESLSFISKNLRKLRGRKNRWKFPPYVIGQKK